MRKQHLSISILCLISVSFMGCIVGYKTFSVEEKRPAQPAPRLDHIKISCTSADGPRICDAIQYAVRTKYNVLDVQTTPAEGADRFSMNVTYKDDKSQTGETWAIISGLSLAIIPAVLTEDHNYRFTITSPAGASATYEYQFTERTYSWLPLFVFTLFVPGYYEDITGLSLDSYVKKRTSIFEDSIVPRLVIDAGPFLLSQTSRTIQ